MILNLQELQATTLAALAAQKNPVSRTNTGNSEVSQLSDNILVDSNSEIYASIGLVENKATKQEVITAVNNSVLKMAQSMMNAESTGVIQVDDPFIRSVTFKFKKIAWRKMGS